MNNYYTRSVSPVESIFSLSPYSVVAMVFRVKGQITSPQLQQAVSSVQMKHPLLQTIISIDDNNEKIFTSENSGSIQLETILRESEEHWMDVYHKHCAIPFEFDTNPCIRFILLQSENDCDLIIFAHHIICDGLSLAYLGRDVLDLIGNHSDSAHEILDTVPVNKDNIPGELKQNRLINNIMTKMNDKFRKDRIFFDFADYKELHEAYWDKFTHRMFPLELSKEQTALVIKSCKTHNVSVNSAVTTAVIGARQIVLKDMKLNSKNSIAVSIRDKILENPGQGMGFYAGAIENNFIYNTNRDFWANALKFHKKVKSGFSIKKIFKNIFNWCYLDPGIMESINFKMLGFLTGSNKLSSYSERDDVMTSILKRNKMDSIDNTIMGTAVTNLMDLKFPEKYGELELKSVIMNPGGAFPLVMVQMVAAVVTTSGRMSVLLEFEDSRLNKVQAQSIKNEFIKLLSL